MSNGVVFYPNAFSEFPSWEDIILHLNDNIVNRPKSVKVLDNLGFVTHNAELIEKVKPFKVKLLYLNNSINLILYIVVIVFFL